MSVRSGHKSNYSKPLTYLVVHSYVPDSAKIVKKKKKKKKKKKLQDSKLNHARLGLI